MPSRPSIAQRTGTTMVSCWSQPGKMNVGTHAPPSITTTSTAKVAIPRVADGVPPTAASRRPNVVAMSAQATLTARKPSTLPSIRTLKTSIARRHLADVFADDRKEENVHPNTYAAHPVACAAALANLKIMEQDKLVENSEAMGRRLLDGLTRALAGHPIVGEIRGRGLMVGVDFVEPDGSGKPLDGALVAELDRLAWDRGAIVYARGTVLRLAPPLCITPSEIDHLVAVVADSVVDLERRLSS